MHIWKISQDVNDGYGTYDSAIVYACTERDARRTHPDTNWEDYAAYIDLNPSTLDNQVERVYAWNRAWAPIEEVLVEHIGENPEYDDIDPIEPGVILASYNAG